MRDTARRLISHWVPDAQTRLGRAIRWPLRVVPSDLSVPVLTGPNRGFRWIAGSSVHGCWIGNYERDVADRLWSRLSPGDVFYDIGANAGYYTLLGSRAVESDGTVVAFEPLPRNLSYLRRHLALNHVENAEVVEAALLDRNGEVSLTDERGGSQARVTPDGSVSVPSRTLDSLALPGPAVVKMDAEGAEARILRGGVETLREHRPILIFSTHGENLRYECHEILGRLGYEVRDLGDRGCEHMAEFVG